MLEPDYPDIPLYPEQPDLLPSRQSKIRALVKEGKFDEATREMALWEEEKVINRQRRLQAKKEHRQLEVALLKKYKADILKWNSLPDEQKRDKCTHCFHIIPYLTEEKYVNIDCCDGLCGAVNELKFCDDCSAILDTGEQLGKFTLWRQRR